MRKKTADKTFCLKPKDFANNLKRKEGLIMEIKVRVFIDNQQIEPDDYGKITICNATVDRIVNDIVDRAMQEGIPAAQQVTK